MKARDRFILHSSNGKKYKCQIVNINEYREPDMKYLIDSEVDGVELEEMFVGERFFTENKDKIEFIKE